MEKRKTTLCELGKEYEKYAELQKTFIDKCKGDIKRAKSIGDIDAEIELRTTLKKLYQIKSELEETASYLKKYYKGEN